MSSKPSEQRKKQRGNPDKIKPYQFKKGESGNPGGRPKSKHISEALRALLEAGDADELAKVLIKEAKAGNVAAIKEAADRTEGKPNQSVTVDGNIAIDLTTRRERIRQMLTGMAGESKS